jgi:hypothetical protein
MAIVQFEIFRDDGSKFGCGEDHESTNWCFAAVSTRGAATHGDYILAGALWHQVLISGVKTLCLTFTGCTW